MSVTMKDVAKHANLSLGTVSNYINGKQSVSKENCEKIERSINELGYKVNEVARCLKTNTYKTIGVLIPSFSNVYLVKIVSYVESILRELKYSMMVLSYHNDVKKEQELIKYLSNRVDGIILSPNDDILNNVSVIENISKTTPIVTINEKLECLALDSVIIDNEDVVFNAINTLIEKGHKKVAMIAGPEGVYTTKQRLLGYRKAHVENNLTVDKNLIKFSNYSKTMGQQLSASILDQEEGITAFFVAGYRMTLGVLSTLQHRKLMGEISVIGFDADDIEDVISPKLTFVSQPYEKMAKNLVELILRRVNGDFKNYPVEIKMKAEIKNTNSVYQE